MFGGELSMSITKSTSSNPKSPIPQLWRCYLFRVSYSYFKYEYTKKSAAKQAKHTVCTLCLYS